jgi:hypothetical protein
MQPSRMVGAGDRTYQALIAGLVGTVLARVVLLGAYAIASALAPAVGGVFAATAGAVIGSFVGLSRAPVELPRSAAPVPREP